MAFLEFKNVRIAGIACGVPENIVSNYHPMAEDIQSADYSAEDFVETTGVQERRISTVLTTSDLCLKAAERLIADLSWDRSEIDALLFVSQTADYVLPATSCILQDKLGLSRECYCEDISLGCSGWVYGLSNAAALICSGNFRKVLLMAGDAKKRAKGSLDPLFGHAGTVTALEFHGDDEGFKFHFGTDGSGYDAIIIPDGGSRNQFTPESLIEEDKDGKKMHRLQTRMKGFDVFSFGITTVPKSIKKLAERFSFNYLESDYVVLHQANMKMNKQIAKKLRLRDDQVPSCMRFFGNTSSASIPMVINTQLRNEMCDAPKKLICCGFGVGLSWGTVAFSTQGLILSDLVEVNDSETLKNLL